MNTPPLVITGASGFVAHNLLNMLAETQIKVCALTRGNSNKLPSPEHIKIKMVSNYSDHTPVQGSILLHLGEPSHVEDYGSSYMTDMVAQASSFLDLGYGHIIYASSATVYGDHEGGKRSPDFPVVKRGKLYTDSKIEVEKIVLDAGGTVARISNAYGPRMSKINIFSDILRQLSSDGPMQIRESTPVREYLWVGDLAKCLIAMTERPTQGIYNVSTNEPVSCLTLAQMILDQVGQSDRMIEVKYPPRHSVLHLDICKTIETFEWNPEVMLVDGINLLLRERKYG